MHIINRMADRLLSAVLPEITAGACCPKDTQISFCYCRHGHPWYRYCSYNCACQVICGGCDVADFNVFCS